MNINDRENRFDTKHLIFYFVLYKVIIELVYIPVIYYFKSFRGFVLDINFLSLALSYIYTVLIALAAPKKKDSPSTYLFVILAFFSIIPLFSYYSMSNQSHLYPVYVTVCVLIIEGILQIKINDINFKFKYAKHLIWAAFALYIVSSLFVIYLRGGIDTRAFSFDTIYLLRQENNISGIFSYLVNWCAKALCPFFIAYFWYKKKYVGIAAAVILQILLYLSFGNKAFLLSLGIIAMVLVLVKRKRYVREFSISMMGMNLAGLALIAVGISDIITDVITHRLIFVPAKIQFQHFEFFINRDKMLFADSQLRVVFGSESPFNLPVSRLLGELFYGPGVNANTGLFADAYGNGGFLMMIILSAVFAFILKFIDISTKKIPAYIVAGALSYIMFVVCDTALLTALNTGGLIVMMFMLVLFNSHLAYEEDAIQRNKI